MADDETIEESPEEILEEEEEVEDDGEEIEEEELEDDEEVVEEEESEEVVDPDKVDIEVRGGYDEEVDYGEDIDPDDVETIGKIVNKQTAGVKKQLQDTQDRLEVEAYIQEKPEFAKYKPVIMKYLQHPVYGKLPVKNIAAIVASDELMRIGAKKEREVQAKADSTKTGGATARKEGGSQTDWTKASKEEFESQKRKVLGQQQ
jgi:hypothetical protein